MLETSRLPDKLVVDLSAWLQVTEEDSAGISPEMRSRRELHTFLGHPASGVEALSGIEHLALLGFNWYGTVQLLYLFFSIPAGPYSTNWRLLDFVGELPSEPPPPVPELPVYAFAVRHAVCTVPTMGHHVHVEGSPHPAGSRWQ